MDHHNSNDKPLANGDTPDNNADEIEQKHFERIVNSFRCYADHHKYRILKKIRFYEKMTPEQQQRLHAYRKQLDKIISRIDENAAVMHEIVHDSACMFQNRDHPISPELGTGVPDEWRSGTKPGPSDLEKTACVLRQIVREWSDAGFEERSQSFDVIIEAVERYCGSGSKGQTRILIPGAGLGRLPYEIAKRGYATQGNEFSMFMLIASNFILNRCKQRNAFCIYPFIHQTNNVLHSSHQLRSVTFPGESKNR
jgi:carnosine N-methyltransferase